MKGKGETRKNAKRIRQAKILRRKFPLFFKLLKQYLEIKSRTSRKPNVSSIGSIKKKHKVKASNANDSRRKLFAESKEIAHEKQIAAKAPSEVSKEIENLATQDVNLSLENLEKTGKETYTSANIDENVTEMSFTMAKEYDVPFSQSFEGKETRKSLDRQKQAKAQMPLVCHKHSNGITGTRDRVKQKKTTGMPKSDVHKEKKRKPKTFFGSESKTKTELKTQKLPKRKVAPKKTITEKRKSYVDFPTRRSLTLPTAYLPKQKETIDIKELVNSKHDVAIIQELKQNAIRAVDKLKATLVLQMNCLNIPNAIKENVLHSFSIETDKWKNNVSLLIEEMNRKVTLERDINKKALNDLISLNSGVTNDLVNAQNSIMQYLRDLKNNATSKVEEFKRELHSELTKVRHKASLEIEEMKVNIQNIECLEKQTLENLNRDAEFGLQELQDFINGLLMTAKTRKYIQNSTAFRTQDTDDSAKVSVVENVQPMQRDEKDKICYEENDRNIDTRDQEFMNNYIENTRISHENSKKDSKDKEEIEDHILHNVEPKSDTLETAEIKHDIQVNKEVNAYNSEDSKKYGADENEVDVPHDETDKNGTTGNEEVKLNIAINEEENNVIDNQDMKRKDPRTYQYVIGNDVIVTDIEYDETADVHEDTPQKHLSTFDSKGPLEDNDIKIKKQQTKSAPTKSSKCTIF